MLAPKTRLAWIVAGAAALCIAAAFSITDHFATQRAVNAEVARAQVSAGLLASSFRRELEKFRLASVVLAQDPDAQAVLLGRDEDKLRALNRKFESLSSEMNAAAIYLMDSSGNTLAASNWRLPTSFIGTSYAFRAYFREAMSSGKYEQFALGSVSRRPGLYIAKRLELDGRPLGVVVIKLEFDALESEWKRSGSPAFASNQQGIILVTNIPSWRFQTTNRLSVDDQRRILQGLEFGNHPLKMNALFATGKVAVAESVDAMKKPYVEVVQALPQPSEWSVHILAPTTVAVDAAVTSARLVVLTILLLLGGLIAFLLYRRKTTSFRAEMVIAERLRVMNDRLVQANKLATIGQIAAGVGHEINQPLAALSSYAHNGVALIKAGKLDDVKDNLERIGGLAARIGAISGELLGFARKATGVTASVSIIAAIDGALLLLRDRIETLGASIIIEPKSFTTLVIAEGVRLEQVLVNLLQNALDAGGQGTKIEIGLSDQGAMVEVSISDNGPGFSDSARATLFQPFSSSKRDGLGLGLVISRDIMADFGGELVAMSPQKGMTFILRLRCAP